MTMEVRVLRNIDTLKMEKSSAFKWRCFYQISRRHNQGNEPSGPIKTSNLLTGWVTIRFSRENIPLRMGAELGLTH